MALEMFPDGLELKPNPRIIKIKVTAGMKTKSSLRYYEVLIVKAEEVKERSKEEKLLELVKKMEPNEELASNIEEAMNENRKVKIDAPDL